MKNTLALHTMTLPRWFAAPFFAAPALMGAVMAGGISVRSLVGMVAVLMVMAGGHAFNSYLDYAWTGLDKGETADRSAEKAYTRGQSVLG